MRLTPGGASRSAINSRVRSRAAAGAPPDLLDAHPAFEPVVIPVVVPHGLLRIAPAVIAFAVVEVDQPQAFGLEAEGPDLAGPPIDHRRQSSGQTDVLRIIVRQAVQLDR